MPKTNKRLAEYAEWKKKVEKFPTSIIPSLLEREDVFIPVYEKVVKVCVTPEEFKHFLSRLESTEGFERNGFIKTSYIKTSNEECNNDNEALFFQNDFYDASIKMHKYEIFVLWEEDKQVHVTATDEFKRKPSSFVLCEGIEKLFPALVIYNDIIVTTSDWKDSLVYASEVIPLSKCANTIARL